MMLAKKTIVYKVVRENSSGELVSVFVGRWEKNNAVRNKQRLTCHYKMNRVTVPIIAGTKLFAFTSRRQAFEYARRMGLFNTKVFKAQAKNAYHNGWLNSYENLSRVRKIFESGRGFYEPTDEFKSCVCCDSIKLLKEIRR
jgi:hypothetical protein